MGIKDQSSLHKIYEKIKEQAEENKWNFSFKVDDGNFETRIDIREDGSWNQGNGKLPLIGSKMFCPDLIDFHRKLIIEYEESAKSNIGYLGAKKRKGHTEYTNTRDTDRDLYYKIAGFTVLKLWDHELKSKDVTPAGLWTFKLWNFLRINSMK